MKCQCEHMIHDSTSGYGCNNEATHKILTGYGTFMVCKDCANPLRPHMPFTAMVIYCIKD